MSCTRAKLLAGLYTDWKSADEQGRDAEAAREDADREARRRREDAERQRKSDAEDATRQREKLDGDAKEAAAESVGATAETVKGQNKTLKTMLQKVQFDDSVVTNKAAIQKRAIEVEILAEQLRLQEFSSNFDDGYALSSAKHDLRRAAEEQLSILRDLLHAGDASSGVRQFESTYKAVGNVKSLVDGDYGQPLRQYGNQALDDALHQDGGYGGPLQDSLQGVHDAYRGSIYGTAKGATPPDRVAALKGHATPPPALSAASATRSANCSGAMMRRICPFLTNQTTRPATVPRPAARLPAADRLRCRSGSDSWRRHKASSTALESAKRLAAPMHPPRPERGRRNCKAF